MSEELYYKDNTVLKLFVGTEENTLVLEVLNFYTLHLLFNVPQTALFGSNTWFTLCY